MTDNAAAPAIVLFAYQDVGYVCLEELLARGANVRALFTHADDPDENRWFRSVAALAQQHGIPVHTPASLNTPHWVEQLRALRPDLILSCYYRQMIGKDILALAPLGAFNMHGSLLPKYRGRAPVNWALLHGEHETGVTLHHMVARADAGDIVDQQAVAISATDTARDLYPRITAAARQVLARQLDNLLRGSAPRRPQDESQASYFGGRRPEDGRIDWQQSATRIFNLIRAVTHPYPGAFTTYNSRRLYIWWAMACDGVSGAPGEVVAVAPLRIASGSGGLEVRTWQWEGAAECAANDASHGLPLGARCE